MSDSVIATATNEVRFEFHHGEAPTAMGAWELAKDTIKGFIADEALSHGTLLPALTVDTYYEELRARRQRLRRKPRRRRAFRALGRLA